jgi:hypothetical protein
MVWMPVHEVAAAFRAILPLAEPVFWNVATCSSPEVMRIASGFQSVKAFTGAPDQERQELQ